MTSGGTSSSQTQGFPSLQTAGLIRFVPLHLETPALAGWRACPVAMGRLRLASRACGMLSPALPPSTSAFPVSTEPSTSIAAPERAGRVVLACERQSLSTFGKHSLKRPFKAAVGFGSTSSRYEDSQAGEQKAALKEGLSQADRNGSPATTDAEEGPYAKAVRSWHRDVALGHSRKKHQAKHRPEMTPKTAVLTMSKWGLRFEEGVKAKMASLGRQSQTYPCPQVILKQDTEEGRGAG